MENIITIIVVLVILGMTVWFIREFQARRKNNAKLAKLKKISRLLPNRNTASSSSLNEPFSNDIHFKLDELILAQNTTNFYLRGCFVVAGFVLAEIIFVREFFDHLF